MSPQTTAGPSLACLHGQPAPPDLSAELATLLGLPADVLAAWRELLEVNLASVLDDRAETFTKRFCKRFEIEPARVAPAIKACRFLFREAVRAGVGRDGLAADLRVLLPEATAQRAADLLLPIFDAAAPKLRQAAVLLSVAEHGRVVRGVRWRMDKMLASNHGAKLDVPVATITLQYQEGPTTGQASYQLLPEQALELRKALDALLG